MDGLSAAASVVAVIQISQIIGGILKDLYRDIRHARTEIERLYETVISLEIITQGLDDLVKRRALMMMNASLLEDSQGPLKQALKELKNVKEKLNVQIVDGSQFEKTKLSVKQSMKRSLRLPFNKEGVLAILGRLENQRSSLLMSTAVNTLSIQFQQSDILEDIRRDLATAQNNDKHRRLIDWLGKSVPDPSIEHNNALNKHEETTGSWLIESNELNEWLKNPNSVLWVHGNAGAGKSILCSTVIDHLQDRFKNEPNMAIVYWYFTFKDLSTQKVDQCLRSLVTNLCSKRLDTPRAFQEAYEKANNGQLSPSTESLMAMLNAAIDGFEDVYIVVDALDECPKSSKEEDWERDEFLHCIHQICSWQKDSLHLLATSRKEMDIEEFFISLSTSLESCRAISVQGKLVEVDIRKYIRRKLNARQFKNWKLEQKQEVEKKLASQADGMFRLVSLQLDVLLNSTSVANIKRTLNTLPKKLDLFYDRILIDIHAQEQRLAAVALQWLASSARPLSLSELAEAITIGTSDDPFFDPEERLMDENQILEFLPAGLVRKVLREQPSTDGCWIPRGQEIPFIEFAHFSVLEYLKSDRMHPDLRATYQIQKLKAHRMIAASCFSYMLYIGKEEQKLAVEMSKLLESTTKDTISSDLETYQIKKFARGEGHGLYESEEIEIEKYNDTWEGLCRQIQKKYILAAYVNRAWQYHMSQLELADYEYTNKLAMQFMDVTGNSWIIWCCFSFDEDRIERSNAESEIRYAAELAALPTYKLWKIHPVLGFHTWGFPKCADANTLMGRFNGTALIAACNQDSLEIARLLIDSGANVNFVAKNSEYATAVMAACSSGLLEVVKLLVESGADVNAIIEYDNHGTALGVTYYFRFLEVVRFPVDSGANVNALPLGSVYGTALSSACYGGPLHSVEIVKLLLDTGADYDVTRGSNCSEPLEAACAIDSIELVRLFLEAGAHAGNNRYIWEMVIKYSDIEVVSLLLDSGASAGSKEEPGSAYCIAMEEYQQARDIESDKAREYKAILDLFDDRLKKQQSHSVKVGAIDSVPEALSDEVMEESEREEDVTCLVLRTTT